LINADKPHLWKSDIAASVDQFNDLIHSTPKTYRSQGVAGLTTAAAPAWLVFVIRWITKHTPHDFGDFRTRWTCSVLSELLSWEKKVSVGRETVRRALHNAGYVRLRAVRAAGGEEAVRWAGKMQAADRVGVICDRELAELRGGA